MISFPPGYEGKNTIAIDFDGVIHNDNKGFHDGTCYGDLIPGAKESLINLASQYKIVIFTAKAKKDRPLVDGKTGIQLIEEYLQKHDLLQYVSEITSDKPRAILYIDDNAYRFDNWGRTIEFIETNVIK
jgi:hypothetical protein